MVATFLIESNYIKILSLNRSCLYEKLHLEVISNAHHYCAQDLTNVN